MSKSWSLARLLRRRVKDWASCLFPTRQSAADQVPATPRRIRNTALDGEDKKAPVGRSRSKRRRNNTEVSFGGCFEEEDIIVGEDEAAGWRHFAEEEYIVFRFRDDGAFDVLGKVSAEEENVVPSKARVSHERVGSRNSDQSDGSFTFPELRWEWSESPDRMPKKKPQRCIRFHCCRSVENGTT